ncbi:hypothetical protein C8J55DRAFT_485990 [Lentinula edodes]|uniref:Uncharacterized protein n=1 Tax=Lentinula lateritia TaxID=40482 RepID=A0A9W9AWE3_9AGAR|nr:hypothetical protein C8J55DRAFT_485990 [Lentinula edodes]
MSATSMERPSSSKTESKKQKSALSRGNTTQAQKSNQAASSTVITVAAGQRLMSIPEQSFGDETTSNIRTPEGRQPEVQGPPPVEPGMGPPQWRYMGMKPPATSGPQRDVNRRFRGPLQWNLGWDHHNGGIPPWVMPNLPVVPWEALHTPLPGEREDLPRDRYRS